MDIKWITNKKVKDKSYRKASLEYFSSEETKGVREFIKSFKEYEMTPLHSLDNLANKLGVSKVWVKDESHRFGLNAFKVLGSSYAIGRYLSERLNIDINELSFDKLSSQELRAQIGDVVFVSATDGNHGKGVAWVANRLGQKSVIFMPKGTTAARLENIRKEGSEAYITEFNYDGAVKCAKEYAEKHNGVVIQDTAWEGYEEIPIWVMQGYTVIADEIMEQLKKQNIDKPTHIFLQAGVGSYASSIVGYFTHNFRDERPVTIIVEPENAACIYKSALINDGKPHTVTGDLDTIMAGLSCGTPNTISWDILRDYSDMYVSCPDYVAARGMRILATPIDGDNRVVSGESGAPGLGLFSILAQNVKYQEILDLLDINKESKILFISTEGATDPEVYEKVVWDGLCPVSMK